MVYGPVIQMTRLKNINENQLFLWCMSLGETGQFKRAT